MKKHTTTNLTIISNTQMKTVKVIIPAGGSSSRYGSKNKLFENLSGKPVIVHSVDLFSIMGFDIIIPTAENAIDQMKEFFGKYQNVSIIKGGSTRSESVYNGLKSAASCDFVIVHDAARPLVSKDIVKKCLAVAFEKNAVIAAVKTTDTVKTVNPSGKIMSTLDRSTLINVQTPQVFKYDLLLAAHEKFKNISYTDDAGLVEDFGADVFYVESAYNNIKITTHFDLCYAQLLLESGM